MTLSVTDVVTQVQDAIAEELGPQRYKLWFKNTTRLTIIDDVMRVEVPNIFVGEWIERHFKNAIIRCAEQIVGRELDVAFSIDANLAKQMRRKQPDFQVQYVANHPERLARSGKQSASSAMPMRLPGRLDEFVVGTSNRLAFSCASSVAEYPATHYNPLFIHGGCGLGKTHLLQAICNDLKERHPAARWQYVSGEDFTNQFVYAVKHGERDAFRQRYRHLDVLVIDDIHFFANKRATQEEFLHTFNAIDAVGKQIVMASDAHPRLIGQLSDSLVSRFLSGMVVKIDAPDLETRLGVLRKRAARFDFEVPDEVLQYVGEHFKANVRELEGALLKLVALARLGQQPLSLSLAQRALADMIEHTVPVVRLTDIESVVAIYFGLTPADLHTSRKTRTIALARGTAMYLARKHTTMSFPEIGRFMGNKNHSTVILAERRIKNILAGDEPARWMTPSGQAERSLRTIVDELEEQLNLPTTNGQPLLSAQAVLDGVQPSARSPLHANRPTRPRRVGPAQRAAEDGEPRLAAGSSALRPVDGSSPADQLARLREQIKAEAERQAPAMKADPVLPVDLEDRLDT